MTVEAHADSLRITRSDGLEVDLAPLQGLWTEEQYLRLTEQTNHLIEFTDGSLEVLPMPTSRHQTILLLLYERLKAAVPGGKVLVAPLRLRLRPGKFRDPDVVLLQSADDPRYQDAFWPAPTLWLRLPAPTDRSVIPKRKCATTPGRASPNTGLSIRSMRR